MVSCEALNALQQIVASVFRDAVPQGQRRLALGLRDEPLDVREREGVGQPALAPCRRQYGDRVRIVQSSPAGAAK